VPRVIASIEARMASSRLPGKILCDINGQPSLTRLARRLRRCERLDGIVLATTSDPSDDPTAAWAETEGIACHRGSIDDVLERVVEAQRGMASEIVVEVCGDTPLLDPGIIDMAVETFLMNDCDVVSNTWKLSFPQGVDAQVFRLGTLAEVASVCEDAAVREHVSLYFYEHPERYRIFNLVAPPRWRAPDLRFQLDYPEDQTFINRVYALLEPEYGDGFGVEEILALLRRQPTLAEINQHCEERAPR